MTNSTWSQNSNNTNWNSPPSWSAVAASPTVGQSCQRTTYTYDPKKKNCKFKYECKKTCKSVSKKECKKQLACTTFKREKCETIQQTVCRGGDRLKRRRLRVKRDLEEKTRRRHKRTIGTIIEAKKQFFRRLFGMKKKKPKPATPNRPQSGGAKPPANNFQPSHSTLRKE